MYDYRRGESILGAFLLGGIVGAALGMLFAPRSGKENREFISEKAHEYWGEGRELYDTGRAKLSDMYEHGSEVAGEKAEELREKIDTARERLREQVDTVSKQAKEKVAEVAPVAKETVHKVGDAVRSGVNAAEGKAQELLDKAAAEKPTTDS